MGRPLDAVGPQRPGAAHGVEQVPAAAFVLPFAGVGVDQVAPEQEARDLVVEAQAVVAATDRARARKLGLDGVGEVAFGDATLLAQLRRDPGDQARLGYRQHVGRRPAIQRQRRFDLVQVGIGSHPGKLRRAVTARHDAEGLVVMPVETERCHAATIIDFNPTVALERSEMTRVFNFSAGPAALPEPVLRQAADEMLDWHGSRHVGDGDEPPRQGVHLHPRRGRGRPARAAGHSGRTTRCCSCRAARSAQNAIVPMNLLRGKTGADYIDTGEWSKKSIKEAKKYARSTSPPAPRPAASPACRRATTGSSTRTRPTCTSARNETIGGVEYHWTPDTGSVPLVADMSSQHPVAPDRRRQVRPDLRRRAEEHRPGRPDHRDRARRPDRPGAADHAFGLRLQAAGRQRLDVQHAADLRDLHRRPGVQVASRRRAAWRRWRSTTAPRPRCCTTTSTPARSTATRSRAMTAR